MVDEARTAAWRCIIVYVSWRRKKNYADGCALIVVYREMGMERAFVGRICGFIFILKGEAILFNYS